MKENIALFWFRRDLRLDDNRGLFEALKSGLKVLPIFIFDTLILDKLENKRDAHVQFIHSQISQLIKQLKVYKSGIQIFHGKPENLINQLIEKYQFKSVYLIKDYEAYARERDAQIKALCDKNGIEFKAFKDQVVFEENELVKDDGTPYFRISNPTEKQKKFDPQAKYIKKWISEFDDFGYPLPIVN